MEDKSALVDIGPASRRLQMDPASSSFDAAAWFHELAALKDGDNVQYKAKRGGFLFDNLNVYGSIDANDYLETFGNAPLRLFRSLTRRLGRNTTAEVHILHAFEGFVRHGEMLAVLGRPGSGCTTLLKTLAGETRGLRVGADAEILYQGITPQSMHSEFRGECIYTAEQDVHFPELTVLETLQFAAASRAPWVLLPGMSTSEYVKHMTELMLSIFRLEGARNTPIGDQLIRGVSGGERKRVSIAESFMSLAPIQFWDNSTRGLDSATALDCIHNFQIFTRSSGATTTVSLYQASQDILDCFDKVTVLYEGRQIFFGTWSDALEYFHGLGYERPARLTTGDYLTALTSPFEARQLVRADYTSLRPVTPDEFAAAWQKSKERQKLLQQISSLRDEFRTQSNGLVEYRQARGLEKHAGVRKSSSFTLPITQQIKLCVDRGFKRLKNNIGVPIGYVVGNLVMSIIVGSVFINIGDSADEVGKRTILLFFAVLINAFMSAQEVLTVWDGRPIVEKQTRRSFYHPAAEAVSAIICDFPQKLAASVLFNLVLYFMANLRRTPGAFFTFWLITFVCQMAMSMFYRCDGSMHRTLEASMVPVGILIMLAIIYAGFVIPVPYMEPWLAWFRHINPVAYAFESLLGNEFHDRTFPCTQFIPAGPSYANVSNDYKSCVATGLGMGARQLEGDSYVRTVYRFSYVHLWRNFGIILAFAIFFFALHLWSSEVVTTQKPRGDVLVFLRGKGPKKIRRDEEFNSTPLPQGTSETRISSDAGIVKHKSTLHWENVSYEVPLKKGKHKEVLQDVDGWVKPGTLTALMGATGAGKTSLLDVIAQRTTGGTITGDIMVDGRPRNESFQRSTGYAQQNDIHLRTATVREALKFSAMLRQPQKIPKASKLSYVENIIELLGMQTYADAVIGVPGDGLSPEQRKRLTIAVELAGRPTTTLFLDEPTSGLDSQTAFSICTLLRDLAHQSGQAIMCTIHQPSATLLGLFDNLLLIDQGKPIYFGEVGYKIATMTQYFESKGARACQRGENPAEWVMDVTGALPGSHSTIDWRDAWQASSERQIVKQHLAEIKEASVEHNAHRTMRDAYATPMWKQLSVLTHRTFVEYWRTPGAVWAKLLLYAAASFMIGVSIIHDSRSNSLQGLQNQIFSIFLLFTTFSNVLQQIAPQFTNRRALFEARERPSKIFSWVAFVSASIIVEAAWQVLLATISWALFYYITGMNLNTTASDQHERAALMLLFFIAFFLFTQSLAHLLVSAIDVPETAINMGTPIFYLTIIFCGVLVPKSALPRFWIFMYRVSPLTYLMRGMFAVGVSGQTITCSASEIVRLPTPPDNQTCGAFLREFVELAGGTIINPEVGDTCEYCPMSTTDQFLGYFNMKYSERWRDFGIIMVFVVFNWAATFALYWVARVPRKPKISQKALSEKATV